jgi:ferredoxin
VLVTLTGDSEAKAGGIWDGTTGRISAEMIKAFVPGLGNDRVMLCGPEAQMNAARKVFVDELKVPNELVHEEAFVSPPTPKGSGHGPEIDEDAAVAAMMAPATEAADAAGEYVVTFKRSGKSVETIGLTVLEAAEDNEIAIPFECRSGVCGQCKCKLISGRVVMESQDALTSGDKAKGLILACQARPTQNCEIEA